MYYEWIQANKKILIVTGITLFIVLVGWSTLTYTSRIGKIGVTISAVPSDATISINGDKAGNGTRWIKPGKYTISAQKEGFTPREKMIDVTGKKEQNVVALSLTPESDTAKSWAVANEKAYKANEEFGAIEARASGEYFRQIHPITNVLPYDDPYYTIAYTAQADGGITLTISTPSPRYRYFAVEKLRQLGYNPSDFKVAFEDFNNPLRSGNE